MMSRLQWDGSQQVFFLGVFWVFDIACGLADFRRFFGLSRSNKSSAEVKKSKVSKIPVYPMSTSRKLATCTPPGTRRRHVSDGSIGFGPVRLIPLGRSITVLNFGRNLAKSWGRS
ncbi:hypothetical protein B0H16DRAFT_1535755 [Mycena metata]|uniref:Uncharacterized protein n=1 Tax=Mycena metata TaxID=1033252 RepID=A0AAD7NE69_9AGAR|nr:hypothetical protein B0H16DRAFT_1535755 [Mycena metata]